jgi:small subunit ribosomal protein S16
VNSERAQYWLSVGAQPTEAVVALLKRTGDWQRFSGDTSPSGVEPQKPKKNKTDAFNAALAESGNEPRSAATKPAKKAAARKEAAAEAAPAATEKAAEATPAVADDEIEGTPAEAQEAAAAGVADAESPEA